MVVDASSFLVGLLVRTLDNLLPEENKLGLIFKLDEGEDAGAS